MGRKGLGVEVRDTSIRLAFVIDGKEVRETLRIGGKVAAPTPANVKRAERLAAEIRDKIRVGVFRFADYFPDSPRAAAERSAEGVETFGKMADKWLDTKGRCATNTRNQYRNAAEIWKGLLGADKPIDAIRHGDVAAIVGKTPWKSPKLLNNYLIVLRGIFALAARDLKIEAPTEGIENSKAQEIPPDPLSAEEASKVLADLRRHYDARIWAYFAFAFATGMRPEEIIALRWGDWDRNHRTIRVERARSAGESKEVKTYQVRDVDLVGVAVEALEAMKPHTFMKGEDAEIFQNPVTRKPWHDTRSQRDHYWKPALRRCGIRQRRAYQTRHTYATVGLMAGANPAYIARQMGHKSAQMLFRVYSRWIDGADRGRERAKIEGAFGASEEAATSLPPPRRSAA